MYSLFLLRLFPLLRYLELVATWYCRTLIDEAPSFFFEELPNNYDHACTADIKREASSASALRPRMAGVIFTCRDTRTVDATIAVGETCERYQKEP